MKIAILTNGYQSPFFSVARGIRQGDSLSALLYIIQAEPLFAYIRNNNDFEGIGLGDQSIIVKGCQYVDDSVLLPNKKKTAPLWINAGKVSRSKLNMTKTVGLRTNDATHDDPDIPIKFTSDSEKLLGIPVGYQIDKDEHWDKLIQKMMSNITPWKQRNLSYGGKVHILKSLGLPQLLYSIEMMDIDNSSIKYKRYFGVSCGEKNGVWWNHKFVCSPPPKKKKKKRKVRYSMLWGPWCT